jgi:small subunit ribosomal protein S1
MSKDDFASMFESAANAADPRARRRLSAGEVVEGRIIAISAGSVFLDVGVQADGQMELAEFTDRAIQVGDVVQVTVVNPRPDGPRLTLSLGRGGGAVNTSTLKLAQESGTPVNGVVTKVVKGGLSVEVGGVRAFCPASQIERGYVENLEGYVGQSLDFKVTEIKEEGRNVIVSRRALLDDQRRQAEQALLSNIEVGATVQGTVKAIVRHGAVIDLGGAEGFVHVSELARQRVDRVEDVLQVGENVEAQVLSAERSDKGTSIRLSIKALSAPAAASVAPEKDEVLEGEVVRHVSGGLIVRTAKGEGMVPVRELDLAPGADHRRAYALGRKLQVVLVARDPASGKLRFSVAQVANVEERANFREFAKQPAPKSQSLGSLGDLLAGKLSGVATKSPTSSAPAEKSGPAVRRR